MNILRVRGRAIRRAALLTGFLWMAPDAARGDTPEVEMATHARSTEGAKQKALAAKDRVAAVEEPNATATDDRKAREKALAERRRGVAKRIKSAKTAFEKFQKAEKRGAVTEKEDALLTSAKADYEAALAEGKTIVADTAALRKLEDEIAGRVEKAAADADAASAAASDAKTAEKSASPIGQATTKEAGSDSRQVKSDADKTKRLAGLGSSADYPKKKAKNEETDGKARTAIGDAKNVLAGLPKVPAQTAAK
jgi:hypothetical protein